MSRKSMKKNPQKSKWQRARRRNLALARYRHVIGVSLIALGAQARAADAPTPGQIYEGGTNTYSNWIELTSGVLMNTGNGNQTIQSHRHNTGGFGGIADLHYETEVAKKTTFALDGHGIYDQNDYNVGVRLKHEDLWFFRVGFDKFRTWDSGIGGYVPKDNKTYTQPGAPLSLDRGRISLEAGLIKPDLPKITFKYDHDYRNGNKGSTVWGPTHDADGDIYRAFPTINGIDEKTDTFQLDLAHHYKEVNYGAGVSYQHGDLNERQNMTFWDGEPVQQKDTDQQNTTYNLFNAHTFAESWVKENLFLSGGFLYANLDDAFSGSNIYGDDFNTPYSAAYPALGYGYTRLNGDAHKHQYTLNLNLLSMPAKTFTITPSLRVNKEDWNANSSGVGTLGTGLTEPFNGNSGRDAIEVTERLDLRYTGVTNWVFSAGGQWSEGQGNYNEHGGMTQVAGFGPAPVNYNVDDTTFWQKYYASARWYPVRQASVDVGGYYKRNTYDYNNTLDSTPNNAGPGSSLYPGFINYQGFDTWDGNVRLTYRPVSKVTLVSRYEYQYSTIEMRPDPATGLSQQQTSKMTSQIIGQNLAWTPLSWLGLQAGVNYVLSTTATPNGDATYSQSVLNAQNNYLTVNANADFILDDKTDLDVGYFYYHANDFKNPATGLPYGAGAEEHSVTSTLTRQLTQQLRLMVRFAYSHYNDTANNGYGSFDSYLVSSGLQYRF
jgi:hypothetical protein